MARPNHNHRVLLLKEDGQNHIGTLYYYWMTIWKKWLTITYKITKHFFFSILLYFSSWHLAPQKMLGSLPFTKKALKFFHETPWPFPNLVQAVSWIDFFGVLPSWLTLALFHHSFFMSGIVIGQFIAKKSQQALTNRTNTWNQFQTTGHKNANLATICVGRKRISICNDCLKMHTKNLIYFWAFSISTYISPLLARIAQRKKRSTNSAFGKCFGDVSGT